MSQSHFATCLATPLLALFFAVPPAPAVKSEPVRRTVQTVDPSLEAPESVKVYVPATVKLKDAFPTTKVRWKIVPDPAWSEPLTNGPGFRFTGPPGKYSLAVDYVDFKKELWGSASATVTIAGAGPTPVPPGPGPGPPPGPSPNRPTGFPGEVFDQAIKVNRPLESVKLSNAYLGTVGAIKGDGRITITDMAEAKRIHNENVAAAGHDRAAWTTFGNWVGQQIAKRNPPSTMELAKVLDEIATGLAAAAKEGA
jgi:hypothetical protein